MLNQNLSVQKSDCLFVIEWCVESYLRSSAYMYENNFKYFL